jgi:hypothetical protein
MRCNRTLSFLIPFLDDEHVVADAATSPAVVTFFRPKSRAAGRQTAPFASSP